MLWEYSQWESGSWPWKACEYYLHLRTPLKFRLEYIPGHIALVDKFKNYYNVFTRLFWRKFCYSVKRWEGGTQLSLWKLVPPITSKSYLWEKFTKPSSTWQHFAFGYLAPSNARFELINHGIWKRAWAGRDDHHTIIPLQGLLPSSDSIRESWPLCVDPRIVCL